VFTERTGPARVNEERLAAIAIEAAEQCRRLSVPELRAARPLDRELAGWPAERHLIVLDESGLGQPIAPALAGLSPGPAALLVGPEGGFTKSELDAFGRLAFSTRVGMGPRILRADTAAIAALACFQALCGDWRETLPKT
jgi:16S rRNA (uracil1498-N3)-methyltransferase